MEKMGFVKKWMVVKLFDPSLRDFPHGDSGHQINAQVQTPFKTFVWEIGGQSNPKKGTKDKSNKSHTY
jgi:hypothetical protein